MRIRHCAALNIYGDQRDSLALLTTAAQAYAQDNQEALDLALYGHAVAEDPQVRTPFMVNLTVLRSRIPTKADILPGAGRRVPAAL